MSSNIVQVSDTLTLETATPSKFSNAFLDVPHELYRGIPEWVPPLKFEVAGLLKSSSHYFEHADARYFIARRSGKLVGRISAQVDTLVADSMGPGTGQFGYFDCEDNPETAAALFDAAEAWLKSQGMTRSIGPFHPSINEEVGLLIDGFETPNVMLMPHGQKHYRGLVEGRGYEKVKELYAYDFDVRPGLDDKFMKMVDWADKREDISFRFIEKKTRADDIILALKIFNDAWRDNWGFTPMTKREGDRFRKSLALILQPELGAFAYYKGEPVAFMIVLPDINQLTKDMNGSLLPFNWFKLIYRLKRRRFPRLRTPLLGTVKEHQNSRIGGILSICLIEKIRQNTHLFQTTHSELSWILEDNPGINNMLSSIGGVVYKRYGLFEKPLM